MTDAIEIAFSFDTTGSMSPCLDAVRRNVEATLAPLFKELPDLKIAICAHGDYCDEDRYYLTKWQQLTNSLYDLTQFVRNVGRTGGGDAPEAYEHVLWEAQSLNWSLNSKKILVMIGDEVPHEPNYPLNKRRTDWRAELENLNKIGVSVYGVQCLSRYTSDRFYQTIADKTGGHRLTLDQFSSITDLILAVIYNQVSPERLKQFEDNLVKSNRMNRAMDVAIGVLSGQPRDLKTGRFVKRADAFEPVPPGRFQIMEVDTDTDIRGFVEGRDIPFMPGKGFYEFTKREEIQERKEIVIRDRKSGDMFTGERARELIGVPMGTRGKVTPGASDFQIFVQSTSYNRKLIAGTSFLYEVDLAR